MQPDRLPLTSQTLTEALLQQLREAVPHVFSEDKIDFEKVKAALVGVTDESSERYGLTWAGKREAFRNVQTPSVGTLRPQIEESVNWDTTDNLILEGDNLEIIKLLQKSYHGKVKLIYIDPPYNTGNEFIYPDNFREGLDGYLRYSKQQTEAGTAASTNRETNGRFHSAWLSMMYPRLFLARNLLKEDGLMLISIDDHEMTNLRLLMDEVFGEENFVATMVWEKGRKNDAKLVSVGHEYLLIYARSQQTLREKQIIWREEKPGARDIWQKYVELRKRHGNDEAAIEEDLSAWYTNLPKSNPAKKWSRYRRVDANGPWRDRDISWPNSKGGPRYEVIHSKTGLPCAIPESGWRFSKPEEMQRQIDAGLVIFRDDHTQPPFRKAHIRPIAAELETEGEEEEESQEDGFATQVRGSYFYKQSQVTVKHLQKLMGAKVFDNPKDYEELAKLFEYVMAGDKEAIVLDFFAGSGSTAEAVLSLNEDGGNRRFILVQLDERTALPKYPTIADITRDRVRRVVRKMNDSDASQISFDETQAKRRGFRAFKLDESNFKIWEPNDSSLSLEQQLAMFVDNLQPGRTDNDRLYEIILKSGLTLDTKIEQLSIANVTAYSIQNGTVLVCLAPTLTSGILRELFTPSSERSTPNLVICLDTAFHADDALKTNAVLEAQTHKITFKTI